MIQLLLAWFGLSFLLGALWAGAHLIGGRRR
jgi:hypothetical protein